MENDEMTFKSLTYGDFYFRKMYIDNKLQMVSMAFCGHPYILEKEEVQELLEFFSTA